MATSFLKATIIAAFDNIWLPAVGGGVAVVNGSNTAQGVSNDSVEVENDLQFDAPVEGEVRVKQDAIGTLEADQTITVGGKRVYVSGLDVDKAGALVTISYTETRQPTPETL